MSQRTRRALVLGALTAALAAGLVTAGATAASAHGFSTTVFVDVTSPAREHVRTQLGLEYDLLVVSAADAQHDDALFQDGTAAFDDGDDAEQAAALTKHAGDVLAYVDDRFAVTADGARCTPTQVGAVTIEQREGVPYAFLVLDHACPHAADAHEVRSTLFGDGEGYVKGAKTIVTYQLDGQQGSAAIDAAHPAFSTEQTTGQRFWEFFRLGAEHLLTGLDHILFLLALIAGSRRLREIVLAATTFTVAHSVTFMAAASGLVAVPSRVVEPVIALSIAVVAGWYVLRIARHGDDATRLDVVGRSHWSLDAAGWARLGVVFCFGLVHGLGFAGALGIDQPWSWTLLWSLFVFNVGIEAVQLAIIAIVFPVLMLARGRSASLGLWATGAVAVGVAGMGFVWFVQRVVAA